MKDKSTVFKGSALGKRFEKFKKSESSALLLNNKKIPLVSKITIGRDKENDIVIDDKMTSRYHAVIQKIKNDFFIQDLGSTNGTFVNDRQTPKEKYVKLKAGDAIRIGKTILNIS
ncbi:MAG TPA: FHA domain-containing protein [Spirochaetota bacterium]|nr:FHA domain-containing protein [Spirochaetota bacterium]